MILAAASCRDLPLYAAKTCEILGRDLAVARKAWLDKAVDPQERATRESSDYLEAEDAVGKVVDFHL